MKTGHIFALIFAISTLCASCSRVEVGDLNEYQVSKSYICIPEGGGSDSIYINNATVNWYIDTTGTSKWLTVEPLSGGRGQTKVTFSAAASLLMNKGTLHVCNTVSPKHVQYLYVTQGENKATLWSCDSVNRCGINGRDYIVAGKVIASMSNGTADTLSIADATGSIYLFGVKNKSGVVKKGAIKDYNIEVGDNLTVQGTRAIHETMIGLKDVTVKKVVKSLVKIVSESNVSVGAAKDTVSIKLIRKGNNLDLSTSVDWLSILSTSTISGGKNADTTVVNVCVAANPGASRKGDVIASSSASGQTSKMSVTISQASAE